MHQRRYEFCRQGSVVLALVYEQNEGRWYVETTTGAFSKRDRVSLDEFERTDCGRTLREQLAMAIQKAAGDL
jgi:hypothetical protein